MRFARAARRESNASGIPSRTVTRPAPSTLVSGGAAREQHSVSGQVSSVENPLEPETRRYFENRFGHDFSRVRVHADSAAASSARSAAAEAYTVGREITFGAGMYNPKSLAGRKLLAHELTHVVQQENPSRGSGYGNQHESEASSASQQAIRGERAHVGLAAPVSMQRQEVPGAAPGPATGALPGALTGAVPHTDLTESASPLMAAAIGSVTLGGFATGMADVSDENKAQLGMTAETIVKLLKRYPASKIRVVGYTDAVGQEKDNQALGQARADSVQAALLGLGIPEIAIETESKGASDLAFKTDKADARNRRVRVVFQPSTLLSGGMSKGLTLSSGLAQPTGPIGSAKGISGVGDVCIQNPMACYGPGPGKQGVSPDLYKPIPDNTPFKLMDVPGINEAYTSHGCNPLESGDLTQTWARTFWRYRNDWGLSESLAAAAANKELSATAGKDQSRDNPNAADRLDSQMKQGYPNATTLGPGSITLGTF
jgi:outer membrane protein OmpA-like peptidoglycan-associated protein